MESRTLCLLVGLTMDNDRIRFFKELLEDHPHLYGTTVSCPECRDMEDDQYCCTLCWGQQQIGIGDMISELLTEVEANVKTS